MGDLVNIVSCSGEIIKVSNTISLNLSPFTNHPKKIKDWQELERILDGIFEQEAARLGISRERYEYSNINTMYVSEHQIFETNYFILDPGNPLYRGLIGNSLGPAIREAGGPDTSESLEITGFRLSQVLFRFPGVDVPGYGNFHSFFNHVNPHLRPYNLIMAYLNHEEFMSFRHGFYHRIGLIQGIPSPGKGQVILDNVDLETVSEIRKGKLYEVEVRNGIVLMSPFASCHWDMNHLRDLDDTQVGKLDAQDIPLKCRAEDTFHFLNGVTPHYMKQKIVSRFEVISKK